MLRVRAWPRPRQMYEREMLRCGYSQCPTQLCLQRPLDIPSSLQIMRTQMSWCFLYLLPQLQMKRRRVRGKEGSRIHSANHIIVVYSNRFVLVFIVSYLRNISQFSPSHSLCFTHLVVVHDVRDLLIQALYSRRLEVSKSTCYTHLLVAGNYRHIPIHWKKNSILLGGNKEFWRRRVSEVV